MAGPWPHRSHTFRACRATFGEMWVVCYSCRRFRRLELTGIAERDYRTITFSCCRCGSRGDFVVTKPDTETGQHDMREDPVPDPERHPAAERRLRERFEPPRPPRPFGSKKPVR